MYVCIYFIYECFLLRRTHSHPYFVLNQHDDIGKKVINDSNLLFSP